MTKEEQGEKTAELSYPSFGFSQSKRATLECRVQTSLRFVCGLLHIDHSRWAESKLRFRY